MIIDSHQHFWRYEKEKHSWIDDELSEIRKDFLPNKLEPIYKKNNVHGCVAVKADQNIKENDFILEQAKNHDFV